MGSGIERVGEWGVSLLGVLEFPSKPKSCISLSMMILKFQVVVQCILPVDMLLKEYYGALASIE